MAYGTSAHRLACVPPASATRADGVVSGSSTETWAFQIREPQKRRQGQVRYAAQARRQFAARRPTAYVCADDTRAETNFNNVALRGGLIQ